MENEEYKDKFSAEYEKLRDERENEDFQEYATDGCLKILFFVLLIIGISGVFFNKGILKTQSMFKESKLSTEVKIIIPFIVTGIIGITAPILLGGGHSLILSLQENNLTLVVLITFIIIKFLF